MDKLMLFESREIKYIKILFKAIMLFFFLVILAIIFFKTNDTVSFNSGIIYSDNPKTKIKSPSEVKIITTFIKEGQEVKKGDTLFVLENKRVLSDFNIFNSDIETLNQKIIFLQNSVLRSQEKKVSYQSLIKIQSDIFKTEVAGLKREIKNLERTLKLSNEQTSIVTDRLITDSLLFQKGVISRIEFANRRNATFENEKNMVEKKSEYQRKIYELKNLSNKNKESVNGLQRNIIETDNQIAQYQKEILDIKSNLENKTFSIDYITEEKNKLIISSPIDGTISGLINTRENVNIIEKGQLMVTVSPNFENYYAKVQLPEKDLIYIKTGQSVNLKIDAYNYYKYGPIRGKINYISPSDINGTFYCLVDLEEFNDSIRLKAGFKLNGEVIIQEMQLYQYLIKKLLNKVDADLTT